MPFKKGDPKPPTSGRKSNELLRTAQEMARGYTAEAIACLVRIMKGSNPSAAVTAASALLNRAWGLPAQTIIGAIQHEHTIGPDTHALSGKLHSALIGRSGAEDTIPRLQ